MASPQTQQAERGTATWSETDDRWLARDARPATAAVLDVLDSEGTMTAGDIAEATGFTEMSVERILGELAGNGIVRGYQRSDRPARYRIRG